VLSPTCAPRPRRNSLDCARFARECSRTGGIHGEEEGEDGEEGREKKTARAKKPAAARLSAAEKAQLLKPGEDLDEIIAETLHAWELVARKVRVPGLSPAKLRSLLKKALRDVERENALYAKQAAKLAPLTDARMKSSDAAYRAGLKVKRIADAIGDTDPAVADAFASVGERFRRGGRTEPTPPEG